MNKQYKSFLMQMIIAIFLIIPCVIAYDTANLKTYYTFDSNTTNTTITDSLGIYNLTGGTGSVVTGLKGNALYNPTKYTNNNFYDFSTLPQYTLNFWIRHNGTTNTQFYTTISNNTKYYTTTIQSGIPAGFRVQTELSGVVINSSYTNNNNYQMITIVHDQSLNQMQLYINGVLQNTNTSVTDLYINSKNFSIGSATLDYIDEMSIWNTTLEFFDIAQLYNSGLGLNYTQTTNGSSLPTVNPLCIDNNNLCNNPLLVGNQYYCDISQTSYCSQQCVNYVGDNTTGTTYQSTFNNCQIYYNTQTSKTYSCSLVYGKLLGYIPSDYLVNCGSANDSFTVPYSSCSNNDINQIIYNNPTHQFISYGVCDNGNCQNDCNINGDQICDSTTSFIRCGNYDTDSCLEYSTPIGCMVGTYCSNGQCIVNNASGIKTPTAFSVTPYAISDNTTTYNLDSVNKKLTVITSNYIHEQDFSTNTPTPITYTSRTCNYIETLQYNNIINSDIINNTSYTFTPVGITSYINISVVPKDGVNNSIIIIDSIGNIINKIYIIRNTTAKSVCLYDGISTLIYCNYGVNSYDDLISVQLRYDFEFQSKLLTRKILFERAQSEEKTIYQIPFTNNEYAQINITTTNITINSIIINSYTQPHGYDGTLVSNYQFLPCISNIIGCKTVRTYNNNDGLADFTNYYDYTVCLNGVNSNNIANAQAVNDLPPLSTGLKYLIFFLILVVLIVSFTIYGIVADNKAMGMGVGIVLGIIWTILCAIPEFPMIGGLIPGWFAVFIIILVIVVGIFGVFKSGSSSNSGGV